MSEYQHLPDDERTDWLLFKRYGSERSRQRLIHKHRRLPSHVYSRLKSYLIKHEPEDVLQVAAVALVEAVDRFDIERAWRFSTFAHDWISGKIRNYVARVEGKAQRNRSTTSYEELDENEREDPHENTEAQVVSNQRIHQIQELAQQHLTPSEYQVFHRKFLQEQEAGTVAEALGLTVPAVRNLIRRVRKKLKLVLADAGISPED